jgi:NTP pyrophosphatase (non-canonical NTP hydrolase)
MNIWETIKECNKISTEHGFWEGRDRHTALLLIHSEISEAVEELRRNNFEAYYEELSDVLIRLFDLMGWEEIQTGIFIDFEKRIRDKMDKNIDRPYKHGKAF